MTVGTHAYRHGLTVASLQLRSPSGQGTASVSRYGSMPSAWSGKDELAKCRISEALRESENNSNETAENK